ncbi:hypothetical protein AYA84_RS19995 [Acinetobacter baumannii]|uniref:hypothetical protein n=1 Tax=Acinetobacter baumannii TaxID=470 RepID=UPI0007A3A8E9|nr:hypothetical protein [Acinetobacter baumannii]EHU1763514.1 hypothetical protein [Acinetobacter baumannii]EHU1766366.1 hypothetical protein [Acinetobacter baumannii]EHU2662281.1 hypothetical protein [Acinetobacter baumannii]EHU2902712.1 hypothetical protein [Acinetobacter baumannii]EHU2905349.1 hypothetical protein [Acinetobacter baumannii]
MDKCREEFEKAFPIPAHWVEFDEKTNRYYCPYVADATASKYQSQWVVWQHLYEKMGELETAIDSLSDENAHFRNKKWDQNEDFTKLQAKVEELETLYTQQGINMLKMQKRVDAAQKLIDDWNCGGVHIFDLLDELEQALKGEGQ